MSKLKFLVLDRTGQPEFTLLVKREKIQLFSFYGMKVIIFSQV